MSAQAGKIKPSQRFQKENKMRMLVALVAVFMVSGAVAQKKPTIPSYDCQNAGSCTDANFKCQFKSKRPSGPIYACKDPKTGKVVNIECKVPPKMKMPKELSGAELQKMCYVQDGRNDGKIT